MAMTVVMTGRWRGYQMNQRLLGFLCALFQGPTCRLSAVFDGFTGIVRDVLDGIAGFLGAVFYGVCGRGYRAFGLGSCQEPSKGGDKRQRGNQFIHDRTFSCGTKVSDA